MEKQVLVIDDDEAIRKSFVLALEDTKYPVDTAESGEKGIELFKEKSHNLIFLDLKMPGLNGVEVLKELRKLDEKVPIYFITAFYAEFFDELKTAEEEGYSFDIMRKPIGADQIVLVTESILQGPIGHE
jgi:DNA-binding response OmpR family regulator